MDYEKFILIGAISGFAGVLIGFCAVKLFYFSIRLIRWIEDILTHVIYAILRIVKYPIDLIKTKIEERSKIKKRNMEIENRKKWLTFMRNKYWI